MDGKVFPVNKMQSGTTAPPFHPWCRGTTAPYYEDVVGVGQRFARDIETGKAYYLPSDTTYEQWKAMQDAKYGEGSVDKARKMHYNESKDKEQFERYKSVLKGYAPKSFADFQNTKYNEPRDWKYLNSLMDYLQKYPESNKVYFDIQQELKKQGLIKNAVVLPPVKKQAYILPEGKHDPYHIMHRMIERNITDDNLREYMSEAKIMISQWGGTRQRFVSEKGMCVIAKVKEDWIFKTAWKNIDYDESSNKMLEVIKNAGL